MTPKPAILTINGGSSSIKFTLNAPAPDRRPTRLISGAIERIGLQGTALHANDANGQPLDQIPIPATAHQDAAAVLIHWLDQKIPDIQITGIGHRVVHGGPQISDHQLITPALLATLKSLQPLDPSHLPLEISLIETFAQHYPATPQVACFDTVFHHNLPRIAQLLPIPRRYEQEGIRRFGFHGLSYTFLMQEFQRLAPQSANGRIILAHLGSGASLAAVRAGQPIDTTMAFTPTAGLVMGTRPGDLDPGLLLYLMRQENMSPQAADDFINKNCGLLGLSESSFDMRDLIARRQNDPRAADAVDLFCYQAKKYIGAYAAALGGLDTLIFSAGIGEHSPEVRQQICSGLEYLGLHLDPALNAQNAHIISPPNSPVTLRIIPTDEESIIATQVARFIPRA